MYKVRGAGPLPVSVIIPCYKCDLTLGRAISSIVSQSIPPSEVIVVIDGDGGENIDEVLLQAKKLLDSKGIRLKVLRLPHNVGPGAARNRGWEQAEEDYVAFLDADDAWHPEKLAKQVTLMISRRMSFSAHNISVMNSEEQVPPELVPRSIPIKRVPAWKLLLANRFSTPTVVLSRSLKHRFKEKGLAEDYYLWLKLALSGTEMYFLDVDLAFLFKERWGEGGMSARLWRMQKGELDTLWRLSRERFYPGVLFPVLAIWSLVKFGRRLVVWTLKRIFARL